MLRVTCGPMFAGKSSALLMDSMKVPEHNRIVVKPKTDTRSEGFISCHGGIKIPAVEMDVSHGSIWGLANQNKSITDVFVDEIQFFKPWIVRDIRRLLFTHETKINVHVYGLDLDYRLEPWPIMRELLPLADEVIKLKAQCSTCGWYATKTIRTSDIEETVLVGEGNHYEPRCNWHVS